VIEIDNYNNAHLSGCHAEVLEACGQASARDPSTGSG